MWSKDLENGKTELLPAVEGGSITDIIFAGGRLILRATVGSEQKIFVKKIGDMNLLADSDYTVSLESPYKTDGVYNSYLGQLHSHYVPDIDWGKIYSSPEPTPASVEIDYKNAGYDFVALTEHNKVVPDPSAGVLHLSNSEEITPEGLFKHHILAVGINSKIDETASDQDKINQIVAQGGIPIIAHPNALAYKISLKELLRLSSYKHLEIFNQGIDKTYLGNAYALDDYDYLLSKGKKVLATAGDDYTPGNPGFVGAGNVVFAKNLDQSEIISNLKDGNFYANQGPGSPVLNISTSGNEIAVSSDKASDFRFIGKNGKTFKTAQNVSSSVYQTTGDEIFIRIEVSSNGKTSWSQPILINKIKSYSNETAGKKFINLLRGKVITSVKGVLASILPNSLYPKNLPPKGYYSPVFSITNQSTDPTKASVSISYNGDGLDTNPDNLSIYKSNDDGTWTKIDSTVDKAQRTVEAEISESGNYTVSADEPEDTIPPILDLTEPKNLSGLIGDASFKVSASDENAVRRINFYIDGQITLTDEDSSDGWGTTIMMSNYMTGSHKLKIEAEDYAGNLSVKEYEFTVGEKAKITSPLEKTYGHSEMVPINFSSIFPDVAIMLDGKTTVSDLPLRLSDLSLGNHTLLIERDGENLAQVQFSIKTSCADLLVTIEELYSNHKISPPIYFGLFDVISNAQKYEGIGDLTTRDAYLKTAISLIRSMSMRGRILKSSASLIFFDMNYILDMT